MKTFDFGNTKFNSAKKLVQERLDVYNLLLTGSNPSDSVKLVQNEFQNLMNNLEQIERYGKVDK